MKLTRALSKTMNLTAKRQMLKFLSKNMDFLSWTATTWRWTSHVLQIMVTIGLSKILTQYIIVTRGFTTIHSHGSYVVQGRENINFYVENIIDEKKKKNKREMSTTIEIQGRIFSNPKRMMQRIFGYIPNIIITY